MDDKNEVLQEVQDLLADRFAPSEMMEVHVFMSLLENLKED